MEVHERIKKRRMELDLSMRDVAAALGVSPSTVSRYESTDIQNMGIDKIESLSKVLHCSPSYLMGWEEKPNFTAPSTQQTALIQLFNTLDSTGQKKLLERAEELRDLGYIQK